MVWGSASKSVLKPLQIVQNKAVKAVHDLPYRTHSKVMYTTYNVLPIKSMPSMSRASSCLMHAQSHLEMCEVMLDSRKN
ncbi:hypothetical protein PR048_006038 [Dryococelus australis]|uniref:Uncharacterized protein n=1 Tax=Dryococelus australis TaxID=614101 RepID=A0ABQ9IB13_9NEOP|nr:hypothetical protein PR048_006038 [Dryococelus australis]